MNSEVTRPKAKVVEEYNGESSIGIDLVTSIDVILGRPHGQTLTVWM